MLTFLCPNYISYYILQVLGTPTREEIKCMNPNYNEFKFPQIKAHPWHKVLEIQIIITNPFIELAGIHF